MSIISNNNIDNNTLMRVKEKPKSFAVVILKAMREQTLIACHDDGGHMDAKKTLHNLKQHYWWPNMRKDYKNYVRSCHKCQVVNRCTANAYGLLQQLPISTIPWEIVFADHVICLPQTGAGNTNMLVHIDHATRYVVATPSASLGAHSVTDALYHNIILRYGPPSMYISDRGTAFTARHTQHFLQKYRITQLMTPPYSPQAHNIVERANGIIVSTLKKLTDKNPDKWDELLPNALLANNTTKQNSTKNSPFYLLFGYEPRLPRELHIGRFIDDTPREDQLDFLILAWKEAANNVYEAHLENKHRFDLHLGAVCYEIKSRTLQNKFIKVVHVQHLRPYFKRDADVMQNNTSDEENDSSAEKQDPAEDHQAVSVTTEPSLSRNHLRRNRRPPKRFEQYVS
ncbi:retrovirus-related Pol polyprotein from transposon 412 [Trichonephila clavipes]|nr:retrovirus-related Pol polyprotein from transposon 412 [Trichonephila clavipes]